MSPVRVVRTAQEALDCRSWPTIACVLRSGGDYQAEDVRRLKTCVDRNLLGGHWFDCLTDEPDEVRQIPGVRAIPLENDWPGWWAKMEVYRLHGPVLYLDLDTVVLGDLAPILQAIAEKPDAFFAIRDFYKGNLQTGLLGWGGCMTGVYDSFSRLALNATWRRSRSAWEMVTPDARYHGDADWFRFRARKHAAPVVFLQDAVAGIVSYKVHCERHVDPPPDARVVCFHGHPRPSLMHPAPRWISEAWGEDQ